MSEKKRVRVRKKGNIKIKKQKKKQFHNMIAQLLNKNIMI